MSKGFERRRKIPLIIPDPSVPWQAKAVFNPAALLLDGVVHIFYRAMSYDNTSVIGYAKSLDGISIHDMLEHPVYEPREPFERKCIADFNSGCEDPRVTVIGDRMYLCYTAYDGEDAPKGATASIHLDDLREGKWFWSKADLITKDGIDDKDCALHPEIVNGKYMLYHRINHIIVVDFGETPNFKERNNFINIPLLKARSDKWDSKKVGISAPPIKTEKGWILFYHGISHDNCYRVGAVLLDLNDPTKVLTRTDKPLFEPVEEYEKKGQVPNVVFPCGAIVIKDTVFIYYGGADEVVNVASMKLADILEILKS